MPPYRKQYLMQPLQAYYSKGEISTEDIQRAAARDFSTIAREHAQHIVDSIKDIDSFIIRWRSHFVETMHPRFLQASWNIRCTLEELVITPRSVVHTQKKEDDERRQCITQKAIC